MSFRFPHAFHVIIVVVVVLVARRVLLFATPWTVARLLCPWDSPGKNTAVTSNCLFQGVFPARALNLDLLHYRQILYYLSHQESPISWGYSQSLSLAFKFKEKVRKTVNCNLYFPNCEEHFLVYCSTNDLK